MNTYQILNILSDIERNNRKMINISRRQTRLINKVKILVLNLPIEDKIRYDKELLSNSWKKYSITHGGHRNKTKH